MKKLLFASGICIILLIISFLFISCTKDMKSAIELKGSIIVNAIYDDEKYANYWLYEKDLINGTEQKYFFKHYVANPVYSADKMKFLALSFSAQNDSIIEYDKAKDETKVIKEFGKHDKVSNVSYMPNQDLISYIIKNGIYQLLDLNTNKIKTIFECNTAYGMEWNKEGTHFLYTFEGAIYKYDLVQNNSIKLFEGVKPVYSANNEYIAFKNNKKIVVKEISTEKEWTYPDYGTWYYRFSPDDKYLVIVHNERDLRYLYGQEMNAWDYRNNKRQKVINHLKDGNGGVFDWK